MLRFLIQCMEYLIEEAFLYAAHLSLYTIDDQYDLLSSKDKLSCRLSGGHLSIPLRK